jgi:hypothetical protein
MLNSISHGFEGNFEDAFVMHEAPIDSRNLKNA